MNANKTSSEDEMAKRHFPLTYLAIFVPTHPLFLAGAPNHLQIIHHN